MVINHKNILYLYRANALYKYNTIEYSFSIFTLSLHNMLYYIVLKSQK